MAHGPFKKSTQINAKQYIVFLLYQCDRCTCFCAISSTMFSSVLDNATLMSWIAFFLQERRVDFFGRCFAVPRKLSCGPQFENHCFRGFQQLSNSFWQQLIAVYGSGCFSLYFGISSLLYQLYFWFLIHNFSSRYARKPIKSSKT